MPGKTAVGMMMDISYDAASCQVGSSQHNHIAWLMTNAEADLGTDGRVSLPLAQHAKVLNLCQDVCAAVANVPTPN